MSEAYLRLGYWGHPKLTTSLDLAAAEFPTKDAVVDPRGQRLTYRDLQGQVDRLARALTALGLNKGDVVAVQLPNWAEYCVAHLALIRLGLVTLFLPPAQRGRELRFIFGHARPRAIIIPAAYRSFDYVNMIEEIRPDLADLRQVIVVGAGSRRLPAGMVDYEGLLEAASTGSAEAGPAGVPECPVTLDDPELMVFSSGTTAEPKGVVHTYKTADYGVHVWQRLLSLGHEDVVFCPATLGHVGGSQWGLRIAILLGAKLVLMDQWRAEEAVDLIDREGCTYSLVTPTFIEDILRVPGLRKSAFRTFRSWVVGGARIRPSLVLEFQERAGGLVLRGFGMTEHFMSSVCRSYDPEEKRLHTDGRPLPGCRYAIFDPNGETAPLPAGQVGELAYRGPSLVDGYFTSQVETEKTFVDGWQLTGDLAILDADGFMTIVDRKKDIIIRGGENISPLELENLLVHHPKIADVAVISYPDERLGERVCAVVVPKPGAVPTLDDLKAYLNEKQMARFKFPERLEIVDELPRTALGKVQKHVLRARVATHGAETGARK